RKRLADRLTELWANKPCDMDEPARRPLAKRPIKAAARSCGRAKRTRTGHRGQELRRRGATNPRLPTRPHQGVPERTLAGETACPTCPTRWLRKTNDQPYRTASVRYTALRTNSANCSLVTAYCVMKKALRA